MKGCIIGVVDFTLRLAVIVVGAIAFKKCVESRPQTGISKPASTASRHTTSPTPITMEEMEQPLRNPPAGRMDGAGENHHEIELLSGIRRRLLRVEGATGEGLSRLNLVLSSADGPAMLVIVRAGTLFRARDSRTQNMVVTHEWSGLIHPVSPTRLSLAVACAEMHKNTPGPSDKFDVSETPVKEDLRRLLHHPDFRNSRVKQFAIWTITDNPGRGQYTAIGSLFFSGHAPDSGDFAEIKTLFIKAGIDPENYRAFGSEPPSRSRKPPPSSTPNPSYRPPEEVHVPLVPEREWTDRRGRKMTAELSSVATNPNGHFEGKFRKKEGEEFVFQIGDLSDADVQLVKSALIHKKLYTPP